MPCLAAVWPRMGWNQGKVFDMVHPRQPDVKIGGVTLKANHARVVPLIAQGWKNAEIADELNTTEMVIKNYLRDIYDNTGMSNRLELALWYVSREIEGTLWV